MNTLIFGWIVCCIVMFGCWQPIVLCQLTKDSNVPCEDFTNVLNFTVAGTICKVFLNNSDNDNCTSNRSSIQCGQVVICEAPAITIKDVSPRVSLFSGGTKLTIRGTNVDKLHPYKFNINSKDNNILVDCKNTSSNEILCRTPTVSNLWNKKSMEHIISHSSRQCLTASKLTVVFQSEPNFFRLDSRENVSIDNNILVLYGENLPEELQDDIVVKIGGIECNVLDVKDNFLSCNASRIMELSKLYIENYITVSSSVTLRPVTSNVSNTANSSYKPERPNTKNNMSPHNRLGPGKSVRKVFKTEPQPHDKELDDPIITSTTETYICYNVSVTIGNYHSDLGVLKVYLQLQHDVTKKEMLTVLVTCSVLLSITVVLILLFVFIKRNQRQRKLGTVIEEGKVPSLGKILRDVVIETKQESMDEFIIQSNDVLLGDLIGSGNFGCVYEGTLTKDQQTFKVAVKTLQDKTSENLDFKSFILEAVVMKDFRHLNVLQLLGLVEKETGVPYVILPFMDNGDLLTYVRRESVYLSLHDVIKFGADIASGMAYLSSLKFVHRDLAARNCMLDSGYTVKVADFGLCRDIYEKGYYSSDNKKMLPIRWMAIESIEHGSYSTKSDVWSLGVVLWEMLTRGLTPYPGVDSWDIINYLRHRRLSLPFFCPDQLYYLMMLCWAKNTHTRPHFTIIQTELLRMIGQVSNQPSIQHQASGANPECLNSVEQQNETGPCADETKADIHNSTSLNSANQIAAGELVALKMESNEHKCNTTTEDSIKLNEQSKLGEDPERYQNQYILLLNKISAETVKNVDITIPECYSDKEVSTSAAGVYIQLVDQYEKVPNFKRTNSEVSGVSKAVISDKVTETHVVENDKFNTILSNAYFILEPSH